MPVPLFDGVGGSATCHSPQDSGQAVRRRSSCRYPADAVMAGQPGADGPRSAIHRRWRGPARSPSGAMAGTPVAWPTSRGSATPAQARPPGSRRFAPAAGRTDRRTESGTPKAAERDLCGRNRRKPTHKNRPEKTDPVCHARRAPSRGMIALQRAAPRSRFRTRLVMWLVPVTLTGLSSRRVLAAIASKPGPATPAAINPRSGEHGRAGVTGQDYPAFPGSEASSSAGSLRGPVSQYVRYLQGPCWPARACRVSAAAGDRWPWFAVSYRTPA
jgi:hypothetical protein